MLGFMRAGLLRQRARHAYDAAAALASVLAMSVERFVSGERTLMSLYEGAVVLPDGNICYVVTLQNKTRATCRRR